MYMYVAIENNCTCSLENNKYGSFTGNVEKYF